jgi:hypothetical protein
MPHHYQARYNASIATRPVCTIRPALVALTVAGREAIRRPNSVVAANSGQKTENLLLLLIGNGQSCCRDWAFLYRQLMT